MLTPNSIEPSLCQPDQQKSCAWCCGLYNVPDSGKDALVRKLRARTERFAKTPRTTEGILQFSERTRKEENPRALDPVYYPCEFVGFLDNAENRVGCLLHPSATENHGINWQELSFYGGMTCKGFFCRSFRELSGTERELIIGIIQDWYLYGLVITDVDYIKVFFCMAEERLGRRINPLAMIGTPAAAVVHQFFHWKTDWPFRKPRICLTCSDRSNPYQSLSYTNLIFKRLGSLFHSSSDRRSAEAMVNQLFSHLTKLMRP